MGRVARYKKIKSCDPYSKRNGGGGRIDLTTVGVWGMGDDGRKPKKRSRTSEKLRNARKRRKKSKKSGLDDGGSGDVYFDAPPENFEDEFDMDDLVGSVKKKELDVEPLGPSATSAAAAAASSSGAASKKSSIDEDKKKKPKKKDLSEVEDDAPAEEAEDSNLDGRQCHNAQDEEMKAAKMLKLDRQLEKEMEKEKLGRGSGRKELGRMEGESKNAYRRRVQAETRQIIKRQKQMSSNPEKRARKIEFLNNRRQQNKKQKRKKGGNGGRRFDDDDGDHDDYSGNGAATTSSDFVTAEQALAAREIETRVKFGEQAERPPIFRQVPRGAADKADSNKKKAAKKFTAKKSGTAMTSKQIQAEQAAMEAIRQKAQAQYALIKARRKQAGEFHL